MLKCIWQISDFIIFTQLLNVPGTVYLMSMGTKMGSKYPVWAPGSHGPVAIALFIPCCHPCFSYQHITLTLKVCLFL